MRSFNFLLLIQYSLNFSIFVIKEDTLQTNNTNSVARNISGASKNLEILEPSTSGSGESGSGHLEPVVSEEDRYPAYVIVRDAFPLCEHGYKGTLLLNCPINYRL